MKSVALYFGSFNPIHKGHIALAEWVVEQGLCDELIFIVSPQNPLKSSTELAPEFSRYEMCEMACASSRYPEQIKVSAVEFVLNALCSLRFANLRALELFRTLIPIALLTTVMYLAVRVVGYYCADMQLFARFVVQVATGAGVYVAGALIFRMKFLKDILQSIRRII